MDGTQPFDTAILFVDDEANILSSIKRELHGWDSEHGVSVISAPSAPAALSLLEKEGHNVGLIVSDLKMPEMLGSDFLLIVRERFPDIVTILLTGFSETEELMKAVKAGIFSYIIKPWESSYLRGELEKALEHRRIKSENARYAKLMEEELRWAGEMQRAILKPNLRSTEGVELRVSYRPVPGLYCGGDYYDVINLPGGRYFLLLGDVAGHGIKGAFITGILKALIYPEYLRDRLGKPFSPAAFLSWLNDRMNFELRNTSGLFITFFAGILDPAALTLTYANAGHNYPYLLSAWQARQLTESGSPLGFAASTSYKDAVEPLMKGDLLFLYTDGLVEAGSSAAEGAIVELPALFKAEPYGQDFHRRMMAAALAASGVSDFEDDLTIVTAMVT
jgi:sigma-B regulation protein RsbU (phosphoserine phosphatase)